MVVTCVLNVPLPPAQALLRRLCLRVRGYKPIFSHPRKTAFAKDMRQNLFSVLVLLLACFAHAVIASSARLSVVPRSESFAELTKINPSNCQTATEGAVSDRLLTGLEKDSRSYFYSVDPNTGLKTRSTPSSLSAKALAMNASLRTEEARSDYSPK